MENKKVIYRPWYNYEKEEQWLNDLAKEGWALTHMWLLRYVFERTEPGAFEYKIVLLENLTGHPKSRAYIDFVEETGTEHVTHWLRWVYFRRRTVDGPLDIYTDRSSQLKHLQTIYRFWQSMALLEFVLGGVNLITGLLVLLFEHTVVSNGPLGLLLVLIGYFLLHMGRNVKGKIDVLKKEMTILE